MKDPYGYSNKELASMMTAVADNIADRYEATSDIFGDKVQVMLLADPLYHVLLLKEVAIRLERIGNAK